LAHREPMHARMFTQNAALRIHYFTARLLRGDALLAEIGVDETRVVAIRHKADFLTVRFFSHWQTQVARQIANLRLGEFAERKLGARQLLLLQPEEKIRLILGSIHASTQLIPAAGLIVSKTRVVTGGNASCADSRGHV